MPRILRIINRFNIGGPTYNAAYLTKYLAPEYETLLIGGVEEESEESSEFILNALGVEYLKLENMKRSVNFSSDRKAYLQIRKIIREFKPDIVHSHASKAGALGRLAAFAEKVPVVVHTFHGHVFHSYFGKVKTGMYKSIEKHMAQRSDAIIAISKIQESELVNEHKVVPSDKAIVIPLGFELQRFTENREEKRKSFRDEYKLKEDCVAIGIIGRLTAIKDHKFFFEVIKRLTETNTKAIKVFVVGGGELFEPLKKSCEDQALLEVDGVSDNRSPIIFTSWIKEIDKVMAGLDLVALSSKNEGTPVSLIEAQAAGLPVISTDVGGVGDVVLNNKSGFVIPKNNLEIYSEKLQELISNQQLRQEFGHRGQQHVQEMFSIERLVNDVSALYKGLLEKKI